VVVEKKLDETICAGSVEPLAIRMNEGLGRITVRIATIRFLRKIKQRLSDSISAKNVAFRMQV